MTYNILKNIKYFITQILSKYKNNKALTIN